jgi:hypothetical protein
MKPHTLILPALALCHLGLVLAGALGWRPDSSRTAIGTGLGWYGHMSGSNNRYGFYAPAVATGMRASFTLTDWEGRTWTDSLGRGNTAETDLRLGTLVSMAGSDHWQSLLPSAWASALLARHPDADQVTIRIDYRELPSMAEHRAGAAPRWLTIYHSAFTRESPTPDAQP